MSITKIEPKISGISRDEIIEFEKASEWHSVPFGALAVDAFSKETLRECVSQYFAPDYSDMRARGDDKREGTALWQMLANVMPQGLWKSDYAAKDFTEVMVRLRILLTYPLQEPWEATVQISANRIGEVFSIAHDMYVHIYELDDAEWQRNGHQDSAPRMSPKMLNRARGKHVWGHDMGDLVFEGLQFRAPDEWPTIEKKQNVFMVREEGETLEDLDKRAKIETVLAPLTFDEHAGKSVFIGTVAFAIGS